MATAPSPPAPRGSREGGEGGGAAAGKGIVDAPWSVDGKELLRRLSTPAEGLAADEAARRLARDGPNAIREARPVTRWRVVVAQVKSPLLLLLVFAAAVSVATGQWVDAAIVLAIVVASVTIGAVREYDARAAADGLKQRLQTLADVRRGKETVHVPVEAVVAGDVVFLSAGRLVPADAVVLEAADLHVSEAVLSGEAYPAAKAPAVLPADTPLAKRSSMVHMGTSVRNGTGVAVVVATGRATEIGGIAHLLSERPPETEFDRGLRRFGMLLTTTMLVLVFLVFTAHAMRGRPAVETLLFSIALAVGLAPELLPAILTVNLAHGAREMASRGVLVRRLHAIENLGSMDVLCTDKTGTLTEGVVQLQGSYDEEGKASDEALALAAENSALQTGVGTPLDEAILAAKPAGFAPRKKVAEIPFDAGRKRVSVVVEGPSGPAVVTKGAWKTVLAVCDRRADGSPLDAARRRAIEERAEAWSREGTRVLGVARRDGQAQATWSRDDEKGLSFVGFLTFLDRPKAGAKEALAEIGRLGVKVKLVTGDAEPVARHVAALVGLRVERVLTSDDLRRLDGHALVREVERADVFAEVDPAQKERILAALRRAGHVVGFFGDGVNDAPAMHASDTSLSAENAVEVARDAADFVLVERDLHAIRRGIEEGRRTFANTLKYVRVSTAANLGNMVSMAVASLFLPFLPLLAGQILLNNFLSDLPAIGLGADRVDPEMVARPHRWDPKAIATFMVGFGVLSSLFDLATFAVLLLGFHADADLFRSGWFVESLLTQLFVALVIRTRRSCFKSRPGRFLLFATAALVPVALAIPFLPFTRPIGFVPVPVLLLACVLGISLAYAATVEATKGWFLKRFA